MSTDRMCWPVGRRAGERFPTRPRLVHGSSTARPRLVHGSRLRSLVSVVVLLSLSWLQPVVCRAVAVESALPGSARRAGFWERAWARH